MELKVFEYSIAKNDDRIWVAAYTNVEAIRLIYEDLDWGILDFEKEDCLRELPKEEWYGVKVLNDSFDNDDLEPQPTIEDFMEDCKRPTIIALTVGRWVD